ncbi:Crp/Fnr family transcriptional regulator [Christiangramia fulva]|uniref:Crp/Fnr family transcriptional regulator n=2 Tax=Christiangramia fulva TaxID=2126553 RepID=A0A2R3ZB56_9FLAO|nr:Crp/Fnr family transcriptional regulator [Christiangramia fulva]
MDLLTNFHEEKWPKNSCILNQEHYLYHFYIIISGRIKMYQVDENSDKEHTLFLLTKGDVFDLNCLFDEGSHQVYYECIDDIKVLAAPMQSIRTWLQNHPKYYRSFLIYSAKMMRQLESNFSQIIFTDISTRLANLLVTNLKDPRNLNLLCDLSNKELANLIGSTRAVVNRHLQKLKKSGSITMTRNQIKIQDIDQLQRELSKKKKNN